MKIKNLNNLNQSKIRKNALEITEAGLQAIDTKKVIQNNISLKNNRLHISNKNIKTSDFNNLYIIGIGKCSLDATSEIENILGDLITDGIVIDISDNKRLQQTKLCVGTHPFPSKENIECSQKAISLLKKADEDDLIIFIISGGGSTLLTQPPSHTHKQETYLLKSLFDKAAPIEKINTIRKHISTARGGFLAKYAYPAKAFSLIFSDVVSNDLSFVASGPTVKDYTTIKDAQATLKKYNLENENFELIETPKESKYFQEVENILVASNKLALKTMKETAEELDYKAKIVTTTLTGEAREIGQKIVEELEASPPSTVLLYGGETTVTRHGQGKGGRNQELALSALRYIGPEELIISIASDGHDNSEFAGAIADQITQKNAKKLNIENYLNQNNSFDFFQKTEDYIKTNYTGSNVADLIIAIKE